MQSVPRSVASRIKKRVGVTGIKSSLPVISSTQFHLPQIEQRVTKILMPQSMVMNFPRVESCQDYSSFRREAVLIRYQKSLTTKSSVTEFCVLQQKVSTSEKIIPKQKKRVNSQSDKVGYHGNLFSESIQKDPLMSQLCREIDDEDVFRRLFRSFFEQSQGKKPLQTHTHMLLTNEHFSRMKQLLLAQMMCVNLSPSQLLLCIWRFESMRTSITNKKSQLEVIGDQNGINRIVEVFIKLSDEDFILQ